ncbi:MAG: hypothetical protein Q9228_006452, partial [Teloschistes exilis]
GPDRAGLFGYDGPSLGFVCATGATVARPYSDGFFTSRVGTTSAKRSDPLPEKPAGVLASYMAWASPIASLASMS